MKMIEKEVKYQSSNTYSTLNTLGPDTRNIWMVFHGIGFLSRYFIRYFDELPPAENYIIAPQAPSKYYQDRQYKKIGASWLTRENTIFETRNILAYADAVFQSEKPPADLKLTVFGFSQGVSVATRWVASSKIACNRLILYSGGIPGELSPGAFDCLPAAAEIKVLVGDMDALLTGERWLEEQQKIDLLFRGRAKVHIFEGGHVLKKEHINHLI